MERRKALRPCGDDHDAASFYQGFRLDLDLPHRRRMLKRTCFSYGYWPLHPILSPYEIPVVGPDFCRHRVPVDATSRRKCGHRRSRISFVFPSMLRRSLFFLDAGPPGVRFRLSLRLLLRLRQSTPLSARTVETVIAGQDLTQSRQDAKVGRLETQNI